MSEPCLEPCPSHICLEMTKAGMCRHEVARLRADLEQSRARHKMCQDSLAGACAERDKAIERVNAWKYNHGVAQQAFYDMEKERDAAKAARDTAKAELAEMLRRYEQAHSHCAEMIRLHDEVEKERDRSRADADRAHACVNRADIERDAAITRATEREAQLDALRGPIVAECVEHVELSGHIDIAEQCRDWINSIAVADGDSTGKLRDFLAALRIVIDQCDRQRRRANWYESAYTAGKQKLIESAVERALSRARAAAQVYTERVDTLGLAADDNDPLVMATARPIGEAQADLYAALGLLERSESGEVVTAPSPETVEQLRAERDAARMLAEVRGRERDELRDQLADANQQVSDLSDQMQSMVEQARRENDAAVDYEKGIVDAENWTANDIAVWLESERPLYLARGWRDPAGIAADLRAGRYRPSTPPPRPAAAAADTPMGEMIDNLVIALHELKRKPAPVGGDTDWRTDSLINHVHALALATQDTRRRLLRTNNETT